MTSYLRQILACACVLLALHAGASARAAGNGPIPTVKARYFAVTLMSGFTPLDDKAASREFSGRRVYQTELSVFGKQVFFLRVGFFKSFADAEAFKHSLLHRYPGAWSTAIGDEEFARYSGRGQAPPVTPVTEAKDRPEEAWYAINLASATDEFLELKGEIPPALAARRLYASRYAEGGKTLHLLNLGFFDSRAEAEQALAQLTPAFPGAGIIKVGRAEHDAAAKTRWTPRRRPPATPTQIAKPAALPSTPDVEARAAALMTEGSQALTRGDNDAAVHAFNQLLMLPPNSRSQDAQEYIGLARERSGQLDKARVEYELYLKLYPEGEGADRVRQRLAHLSTTRVVTRELKEPKKEEASESSVYGSWSQNYYRGASKTDTTTTIGPIVDQASLSSVDQSSLVSNLDFNARWRTSSYDNKFVIRDTHIWNFLEDQDNDNRLSAAYFDHKNRTHDYSARVGRQSGSTGGVLGRFDGLMAGWNFLPKWRANVVAGKLANTELDTDQVFYGTSLDLGTFAEHWNTSLYYIVQHADDIVDREAVGAELRYFDPRRTMFSLIDYDVSYGELNIAMLQGTRQTDAGTSFNLLADYRKTPALTTTNALIGEATSSVTTALSLISEEALRQLALDRTATASQLAIGVTHPVTRIWQLGADLRMSRISGLPATTTLVGTMLPEAFGGGKVQALTLQAIGTGLITDRDITVISVSGFSGETYDGQSVSLTNRSIVGGNKWNIDSALRWYHQKDDNGTVLSRTTPSLKLGYRASDKATLELEAGVELTTRSGMMQEEDSKRSFYNLGYRWDF